MANEDSPRETAEEAIPEQGTAPAEPTGAAEAAAPDAETMRDLEAMRDLDEMSEEEPEPELDRGWKCFFAFLLISPVLFINVGIDNDIWFLLNSGRYVLANGIPHVEPFTMHANMHFVMPQWLSAVLYWKLHLLGGDTAIKLFVLAVYALIIVGLFTLCMLVSRRHILVSFCVTMAASLVIADFVKTRPQVISALILVIELNLLEAYIRKKNWRYLIGLPVLSLAMINFHASMWIMLFIMIAPYFVNAIPFKLGRFEQQGYPILPLFIATAAMFGAGFLNPYGLEAMTYLFRSYGYSEISTYINEMLPPNVNSAIGRWFFLCLLLPYLGYYLHRGRKIHLRYLLLTLGLTYMGLSSVRSILLFGVGAVFPLASYYNDLPRTFQPAFAGGKLLERARYAMAALIMAAVCIGTAYYGTTFTSAQATASSAGAVRYLLGLVDDPSSVNVYTSYNDGDYVEYMGFKCYIDARAEVFVKKNNQTKDIMREYYQLQKGRLAYQTFLLYYNFNYLIVPKYDIMYVYFKMDHNYESVYSDDHCSVYVQSNGPEAALAEAYNAKQSNEKKALGDGLNRVEQIENNLLP